MNLREDDWEDDDGTHEWSLAQAARRGDWALFSRLMTRKVNFHAHEESALRLSSCHGHLDIVVSLLEAGADLHAKGDAALIAAAANGKLSVVDALLGAGANVHAQDDAALSGAAANGMLSVVQALLDVGANQAAGRSRALISAASNGRVDVIKRLLPTGTVHLSDAKTPYKDADILGQEQTTIDWLNAETTEISVIDRALRNAAFWGHIDAVRLLLGAGADARAAKQFVRRCLIYRPGNYDHSYHFEASIINVLVNAGSSVEDLCEGMLGLALGSGDDELIENLLNAGATVDEYGESVLKWACAKHNSSIKRHNLDKSSRHENGGENVDEECESPLWIDHYLTFRTAAMAARSFSHRFDTIIYVVAHGDGWALYGASPAIVKVIEAHSAKMAVMEHPAKMATGLEKSKQPEQTYPKKRESLIDWGIHQQAYSTIVDEDWSDTRDDRDAAFWEDYSGGPDDPVTDN